MLSRMFNFQNPKRYPGVLEQTPYRFNQPLSPADAHGLKHLSELMRESAKATEEGTEYLGDMEHSQRRVLEAWANQYAPARMKAELGYAETQAGLAATRAVYGHRIRDTRRKPGILQSLIGALLPLS